VTDRDPERTAVRATQRELRLGVDAACVLCGKGELAALQKVRDPALAEAVRQAVLEEHHVLGRALDPELKVILCRTCHAVAHETLRRGAVSMVPQGNVLDRLITCLGGLIAFLHDLSNALERHHADLEALRTFLDAKHPTWRDLWKNRR
jgi:hypothetical protein